MLPPTHKALVQEVYGEPLKVKEIATPQPDPGSVVIKVIAAPIISYSREVYNGQVWRFPADQRSLTIRKAIASIRIQLLWLWDPPQSAGSPR